VVAGKNDEKLRRRTRKRRTRLQEEEDSQRLVRGACGEVKKVSLAAGALGPSGSTAWVLLLVAVAGPPSDPEPHQEANRASAPPSLIKY